MGLRLNGKSALVTGAASGIGLATAEAFCREGACVVLADTQAALAERAAAELRDRGGRAVGVACDVTRTDEVCAAVEAAVREFGRLDVLFANAGIAFTGDLVATTDEDWDRVMGVNAKGVFVSCREAVRQMLAQAPAGGSVVINGSISGLVGIPGQAPYAPSKGAVVEMTRQLAVEYARRGVRVNCVCPGTVDTPLLRQAMTMAPDPRAFLDMLETGHPIGRIGRAEEVAALVAFLASDEASFITGAIVPVARRVHRPLKRIRPTRSSPKLRRTSATQKYTRPDAIAPFRFEVNPCSTVTRFALRCVLRAAFRAACSSPTARHSRHFLSSANARSAA